MYSMKLDLYLKSILTVIAIALVWIALRPVAYPDVVRATGYNIIRTSTQGTGLQNLRAKVAGFSCPNTTECYILTQ